MIYMLSVNALLHESGIKMDRLISIKVFVAVVEHGSLAAAAKLLDISRSMATRHITALEDSLQTRLLHRTTRNLGVTSAGEELLPFCRTILDQEEKLYSAALAQKSDVEGKISIATSISFGQLYLAGAIERFMDVYPQISIDLRLSDNLVDLIEEKVDIAIELNNQLPEHLIGKKLGNCSSILCATPDYFVKHGLPQSVTELRKHNCLIHKKFGNIWDMVDKTQRQSLQVKVDSNYTVNDSSILLNAVLAGRGIACLPLPFVKNLIKEGVLETVLSGYEVNLIGIWALYASRSYQPRIHRLLLDFIEADLRND